MFFLLEPPAFGWFDFLSIFLSLLHVSAYNCLPLSSNLTIRNAGMTDAGSPSAKLDGKVALFVPTLDQLAKDLEEILKRNFQSVNVSVVGCPDLTLPPFNLISKGLAGSPRIVDVGGPGNLFPVVKKTVYNLVELCRTAELPVCHAVGPGAGPLHLLGYNTEVVHNVRVNPDGDSTYGSYVIYLKEPTPESPAPYDVKQLTNKTAEEFILMSNLLLTEGHPGPVLKVEASKRTGTENFITQIRRGLAEKYDQRPVGLAGVFVIKTGRIHIHIMPEIPKSFASKDDIDEWLHYFDVDAPLTCVAILITHDPGLDLRNEHTHCFNYTIQGGHYHYDVSPEDVQYVGYFTPAQFLYRIDRVSF